MLVVVNSDMYIYISIQGVPTVTKLQTLIKLLKKQQI